MSPKIIPIPISGDIEVDSIIPLLETPEFQALGDRKQLGTVHLIFRGAVHTRFEHSLGVYSRAQALSLQWQRAGILNEQDVRNISICGLLHDIGHGPFSHMIEPVCQQNHKENGIKLLRKLRPKIEACGGNTDSIIAMLQQQDPLGEVITHHTLGMDKHDYLDRDAFHTNQGRPALDQVRNFTLYQDNQVMMDVKVLQEAMLLQTFYVTMYNRVYLRKRSLIDQRLLQKLVSLLFAEGFNEDVLWTMTDSDLLQTLKQSKNPTIHQGYERFRTRNLHQVAIAIRPRQFVGEDPNTDKAIVTIEGPAGLFSTESLKQPNRLSELEKHIAQLWEIPEEDIVLIPTVHAERFVPPDVAVLTGAGVRSLREMRPEHYAALECTAQSYAAVRICVDGKHRVKLANRKNAEQVLELLPTRESENPPLI